MAQDNEDLFGEANTAYNQGNYSEAISNYQQILEGGYESAALYYNLGNAHYRENNVAPSIYFYEKALQLNPNDEDIRNNLAFAREMLIDDIQETPATGFSALYSEFTAYLDYNSWAWVAVTFSVLFAIFFFVYYFSSGSWLKRIFFTLSIIAFIVFVASFVFAYQQKQYVEDSLFGIVFAEEVEVRSEPNSRSDEIFQLHEGTKIQVLETYQDWIKFELANGIQGWMDKANVRLL